MPAEDRPPIALTIAGSDSGGGAGIQADLKTFEAHGVYGASVITLVTAQNTQAVTTVHPLPPELVHAQLDAVLSDFNVGAIKIGALGTADIISVVADALRAGAAHVILDPVMVSKHGHMLIEQPAVARLKARLPALARLVTPNLHEAAALADLAPLQSRADMLAAASELARRGWRASLIKGGHLDDEPADLLWDDGRAAWLPGERIDSPHLHGTGCTFSAAIAANLVRGLALGDAAAAAKEYISGAIRAGISYGQGVNPVRHGWRSATLPR